MKFCPYCGADLLKEDAAFCAECGKKLSVAEEAPSPAHEADSQHEMQNPANKRCPRKALKSADSLNRKRKRCRNLLSPKLRGNL